MSIDVVFKLMVGAYALMAMSTTVATYLYPQRIDSRTGPYQKSTGARKAPRRSDRGLKSGLEQGIRS
jgi:hypothetical protein